MLLTLVSDNPLYPAYDVELDPQDEIWKASMFMNTDFSKPQAEPPQPGPGSSGLTLESLYPIILRMQQEIIDLKKVCA